MMGDAFGVIQRFMNTNCFSVQHLHTFAAYVLLEVSPLLYIGGIVWNTNLSFQKLDSGSFTLCSFFYANTFVPGNSPQVNGRQGFYSLQDREVPIFPLQTTPKLLPEIQYTGGLQLAKHDLVYSGSLKQNKNEQNKFTCVKYLHSFVVNTWFPNSYLCFSNRFSFPPQKHNVDAFGSLICLQSAGAQWRCEDRAIIPDLGVALTGSGQHLSLSDRPAGSGSER